MSRIDDVPSNVLLQLVATFAVWMAAERAGLSAIALLELTADTRVPPTVEAGPPATAGT